MKKREIHRNLKAYFLISNIILSIIAFSFILGSASKIVSAADCCPPNKGGGGTSGNTGTSTPGKDIAIGNTPIGSGNVVDLTGTAPPGLGGGGTGTGGDITDEDVDTSNEMFGDGGEDGGDYSGDGFDDTGLFGFIGNINWQSIITKGALGAGIFGTVGALSGGDDGALWGSVAGMIGGVIAGLTENLIGETWSTVLGLGVATFIFLLTWKKKSQEIVEFNCLAWQAPIGGEDCQKCNNYKECSLYTCKSLGQACDIINPGTPEQKCIWKNPYDVNSPKIEFKEVTKSHKFKPNPNVRPPQTGVMIIPDKGSCIKAFTPLEFKFETDEPSQCKIDYNLTTKFDEMGFYVGGDSLFSYNHTEKLSLPGPDAINAVAPELKNDGSYSLFIRCKDANGNFNQDAYSVSFCVEKGPDTTPPKIESTNIPSEKPVQFNQSTLYLEVYVNEPSECKWSREDRAYENMENKMSCLTDLWEMNWNWVYTCKTNLTGMESRKENKYYFRCKDKPWAEEGERNVNSQSYLYKIIGTQPLNIMSVAPKDKISGATDTIPVFLEIETDNGYKNGESLCYYYQGKPLKDEDYILFLDTNSNKHKQRQDLVSGDYTYYFKCVDLGGNTAYNSTNFRILSDKSSPNIVRVYKESGELKIITDEESECSYSNADCNFEIESGIKMDSFNKKSHTAIWKINQNYYIRCKDNYNNQPNPNVCSIVAKPSKTDLKSEVIEIE